MIFLDNASTTKVLDDAIDKMNIYNSTKYFNPSAKYGQSLEVLNEITKVKSLILKSLNADSYKVVFTSGATEGNNLALYSGLKTGKELVISQGEHSSVYEVAKANQNLGRAVHYIPLKSDGTIDEQALYSAINDKTGIVSIIHTSNETGAVNDIKSICEGIKKINSNVLVHTDIVQSYCKIEIDLEDMGVDMATISSHKIHGPKGIGALIYRNNISIKPLIFGGGQENSLRSGTENVPAIMGFGTAVEFMNKNITNNYKYVSELREYFIKKLSKELNKDNIDFRVVQSNIISPYIVSMLFKNYRGEVLLHYLEKKNVLVGTGSACSSHTKGNRILRAIGYNDAEADGNLRFSFSNENTIDEIDETIKQIKLAIRETESK